MYMKTFNLHQMANYYPPYNQVFFSLFLLVPYSTGPVSTGDNLHPEAIGLRQTKHSTTGAIRQWVFHGHSRQADAISHTYSDGFRGIDGVSYNERTNNIELFFFFCHEKFI